MSDRNMFVRRLIHWIVRFRWAAVFLLLLFVFVFHKGVPTALTVNTSFIDWYPEEDPRIARYVDFQEAFGNDEVLCIAISGETIGRWNEGSIEKIRSLTKSLESIEGVQYVVSPTSFSGLIGKSDLSDEVSRLLDSDYYVADQVFLDQDIDQLLINQKMNTLALWVFIEKVDNIATNRNDIVAQTKELVRQNFPDNRSMINGLGVFYGDLNNAATHDMWNLITITMSLLVFLSMVMFRSFWTGIGIAVVLSMAGGFVLGLYGSFGNQSNLLFMLLPTLILAVALTDMIHFPTSFVQSRLRQPVWRTVDALERSFAPCLMTTLTTTAGLLSLCFSNIAPVRQFGIYGACGVLFAFVCCLPVMAIVFYDFGKIKFGSWNKGVGFNTLVRISRHPVLIGMTLIGTCLVVLPGFFDIRVNTNLTTYMDRDTNIMSVSRALERDFGDFTPLEFVISSRKEALDPEVVFAIQSFQSRVKSETIIGQSLGIGNVYKWANKHLLGGSSTLGPMDIESINESLGGSANPFPRILNPSTRRHRVTFYSPLLSSVEVQELIRSIEQIWNDDFGTIGSIEPTGLFSIYGQASSFIGDSFVRSMLSGSLLVFGMVVFWLRSVKLAVICLASSVFPMALVFAAIGYLGIDFDVPISVVTVIILGVSVDDSIHFIHHYINGKGGREPRLTNAFSRAGVAAIVTSIVLVVAFLCYQSSEVRPVGEFGILLCVGIVGALVSDLLILPAMLRKFVGMSDESGSVVTLPKAG